MRPRQFDEDAVLRIAFERFRREGVRGASLTDIARDAGVMRGSLYNAFGGKEALFLRAYARYAEAYLGAVSETLASDDLRAGLTAFFDFAIENFAAGAPARGCPTTRALMELPAGPDETLERAALDAFAGLLAGVQARLEHALRTGAALGVFTGDPAQAAEHLLTVARGLVVMERAFGDATQLRRIARHAIDLVLAERS